MSFKIKIVACALFLLSACARQEVAVVETHSPYQKITVMTPGQAGAQCLLQAGAHSYTVQTPGTVLVSPSSDGLNVSCFKGDHLRGKLQVQAMGAPVERGLGEGCTTCTYPATLSIPLRLSASSFEREVIE